MKIMKGANIAKNVKTFTRILPSQNHQWEYVKILEDGKTIYTRCLQDFLKGNQDPVPTYWSFETDRVFFKECQEEIYDSVSSDVIEKVFKGQNAFIIAYGQIGTGKSLTLAGLENFYEDRGLAPRIITDLMERGKHNENHIKTVLYMSYVEIEKKYVHDLLQRKHNSLDVFSMNKVEMRQIKNEYEALHLLFLAEARREVVYCNSYYSNKYHGVLTFHVVRKNKKVTNPCIISSKLHLIDLAGCDSPENLLTCLPSKTNMDIALGNLGKTQLGELVLALIDDTSAHISIKKKNNLLIYYLGDSLNSYSLFRFIGHIKTGKEHLLITLSSLRFSQMLRNIKGRKFKEPEILGENCEELQASLKLKELLREMTINSMISNGVLSTNINQDRIHHIRNMTEAYLANKTNEMVILNVTDALASLIALKEMYRKLEQYSEQTLKMAYDKAYLTALDNVKPRSLMESRISVKTNISKKSTKSRESTKESIFTDDSKSVKMNRRKSQDSRITNRSEKRGTDSTVKSLKKPSRGASLIQMKRERKRSSSVMSLTKIGLDDKMIKELGLPESIPDPQIAWDAFTLSDGYEFKELKEELVKADTEARDKHYAYLLEVKQIDKCLELVELRREELDQASIQDKIYESVNKQEDDRSADFQDDTKMLTEREKVCLDLLSQAEAELIQQQERVLQKQAELKVYLDRIKQLKKDIRKQFQKFCRDTYSTLSTTHSLALEPDPEEICEKNFPSDEFHELAESDILDDTNDPNRKIYQFLQNLMKKERVRFQKSRTKFKKWNPYTSVIRRSYYE